MTNRLCARCGEPILPGEGPPGGYGSPLHMECAVRSLMGSLGRLERVVAAAQEALRNL